MKAKNTLFSLLFTMSGYVQHGPALLGKDFLPASDFHIHSNDVDHLFDEVCDVLSCKPLDV